MFLSAYVAFLVTQLPIDVRAGESDLSTLKIELSGAVQTVNWSDAEDRVRGTISPVTLHAGQPMKVSVSVGAFQGEEFAGPVTFSLRPIEDIGGADTVTVKRGPGEKAWAHEFIPREAGEHRLEISWRTTRLKVARGTVMVERAFVPPWVGWTIGVSLVVLTVGVGAWWMLQKREGQASS